jgi:fructose-bisphosphate aldolase, class I
MTATAVDLATTAQALVAPWKGILAADESAGKIAKRFASVGRASTDSSRLQYRRTLFTAPGIGQYLSGVILFDETIHQTDDAGGALVGLVVAAGLIPGIKLDRGTIPMPGFPGEMLTEGRFAALSLEAGLVPVVEPDILMDGDHSIARVALDSVLLKTNMVLPGKQSGELADWTLRCLRETLPPADPGVVFLSGGQSPEEATANLAAPDRRRGLPWQLSFSFSRALQEPVLQLWAQDWPDVARAQQSLVHRAAWNSAARCGSYAAVTEPG